MSFVPAPGGALETSAQSPRNQRESERFGIGMEYTLDGKQGRTRDLSATGLSFESDIGYPVGTKIQMTLRYGLDGHNFPLPCEVEVMRVEPEENRFCIAARFCQPFLP